MMSFTFDILRVTQIWVPMVGVFFSTQMPYSGDQTQGWPVDRNMGPTKKQGEV